MLHRLRSASLTTTALILSLVAPLLLTSLIPLPTLAQNTEHQASKARADKLLKQGIEQYQTSQFEAALQSWQQALIVYRSLKDRLREGQTLGNIGLAYYSFGNYLKAIDYHNQSLSIARQIKNKRMEGNALNNLGMSFHSLGDYLKAINYHQQSLIVAQKNKDRLGEENALGNLGIAYDALGEYPKAINYQQQSLSIAQELKDRLGEGQSLSNLGSAYSALGNYLKAIEYNRQRLVITREIKDRRGEGASLRNLGIGYDDLGDYVKAINYYRQSLAIAREIKNRWGELALLGDLGFAYYHLKDYSKALVYCQQSLTIAREIKDLQGEGAALGNLGLIHDALEDYQKAIYYQQKSLAITREIKDKTGEGLALSLIGKVLTQQKQPELAIVFYKQSVNVREDIRRDIRKLPREEQQNYTQSVADTYRKLASLLLQQGRIMEALQILDLLKVQELQDFFKDVKGNERTAKGIEMLSEEQQILSRLDASNLNQYLKSTPVTALVDQLQQTATSQNLKLAAYTNLQIRLQHLGTNSALLYPLILDDRIELVLFTRNTPPIHRTTTIKKTELEQAVQSFRAAIQQKDSQDIQQPAHQLYDWLIKPIEADLQKANIKTLIYAPDGQMRYVPLAALYDGKQWLVEKYQINYITALSLTNIVTRSPQPPHILAGAFTDSAGNVQVNGQAFDFGAIPSALSEVNSLAKQFPNTTKLVNKDFNHASMTFDRLNRYNIVHLATHGKLVAGAPEDSFILLNNNEYITLREIKDWKLPNVALVVLSACQTALGDKLGSGIEVIGFGYQLQQAQARASIATLWEISDASTGNLMNEFYARLQSKQLPPVEALREAQIALITGKGKTTEPGKPRTSVNYPSGQNQTATISRDLSHPYYWAPFILIGNGL